MTGAPHPDPAPDDEPDDQPDTAALRAERDAWEARAREAERVAEQLAERLAAVGDPGATDRLSLFDDVAPGAGAPGGLSDDGSDPRLLPLLLGAVAVVLGMVAVLSLANNGLFSLVTLLALAVAVGLGWAAWETRVQTPEVTVVKHMVLVAWKGETHRFDLRSQSVTVETVGTPGSPGWRVRLLGRGLETCTIDASMVDPYEFTEKVRGFRPEV